MTPHAKVTEVRCVHSYQVPSLYRLRGYGFDLYTCETCFNNLISLINHTLLNIGAAKTEFKDLGIYCDRCDRWKVGTFYITRRVKLRQRTHIDSEGREGQSFILETGTPLTMKLCENCYKEVETSHIVVTTRRNIYISDEEENEVMVKALYEDRIEKTNKMYMLMPTEAMRQIFSVLTPSQKLKLGQLGLNNVNNAMLEDHSVVEQRSSS